MKAVTTLEQLAALDGDTMLAGYLAGYHNEPNYTRREQAYWHGYLNGQVDGGYMPKSDEQAQLARAYIARAVQH